MPRSPSFKPCSSCSRPMPSGDPHDSCLKCLGESHRKDKCRICKNFRPKTQKEQDIHLRALLMQAALRPALEPSHSDSTASNSISVRSAVLASGSSQHYFPLPVPKKWQKKSPPAPEGKGALGKGHVPALGLHGTTVEVGLPSPARIHL